MALGQTEIGMAKEALNTQDTAWQHAETRAAILASARHLLADGDGSSLSLDAVAEATGFAQTTVYAYFASRGDLLTSILCDDIAIFAQSLREGFPFSPEPEPGPMPEPTPILTFVLPAAEPETVAEETPAEPEPATEPEPVAEAVTAEPEQAEAAPQPAAEEPAAEEPFVEDPVVEGDEIARMKAAIAKLEGRRVDAWLERRLRVFETTLANLETRVTASEGASQRAATVVEETVKAIGQRAEAWEKRQREAGDGVAERLEASDRKSRGTVAELRAALNDVYGRLETLEIAKGVAVTPSPPLDMQWEAGETIVTPVPKPQTDKPLTAAAETYLSAARRAAKTAADLAEIERGSNFLAAAQSWTRTRLILAACIGLGAVMVIAGLAMHYMMPATQHIIRPLAVHRVVAAKIVVAMPRAAAPVATAPAVKAPPPHPDMAVYRMSALASTGNANAELLLGLHALDGGGDDAKAAQLFQQSAAQGNAIAQYWLGTLYERGRGVKADPVAAWRWYSMSAKKGNVKAMYNLAVAEARGKGTKANTAQAAHWFWVSAMQGYVDAQYNLAVLYERGQGVPQSLINAYKWYAIAAAAGDKDSKASIDALKTQLTPAELGAGQSAATAYKSNPSDAAANTPPNPSQLPGG